MELSEESLRSLPDLDFLPEESLDVPNLIFLSRMDDRQRGSDCLTSLS